jgi:dihydroorotate dehydrogenase electron transfer subunit
MVPEKEGCVMDGFLGGCRVIGNDEIGEETYLMELECEEIAREVQPGQFVHIRVRKSLDPFLRRPFSVHDAEAGNFKLIYDVVGRGTRILSEMPSGAAVDVLGPLGKGFDTGKKSDVFCLVAGGMGIAPLLFLAKRMKEKTDRLIAFIGAGTRPKLFGSSSLRSMGIEVFTATDDGSEGFQGLVTELFVRVVDRRELKGVTLFACGPKEMLSCLAKISSDRGFDGQASLEELMACGVGACLGCAVRLRDGRYGMVCKDGPVFDLDEVVIDG